MPLVRCPDCGRAVSDAAEACPECARPLTAGGFRGANETTTTGEARPEADAPSPTPTEGEQGYVTEVRPWVRYFARFVDISLASFFLGVFFAFYNPEYLLEEGSEYGIAWFAILLWVPVEAWWLSATGSTPGKALLKTRVRSDAGHRLSYGRAFGRSIRAWFFGLGTGFPLIALFTMAYQHGKLKKNGEVSWDRNLGTRVEHAPLSAVRISAAVLLILIIVVLSAIPA